MCIFWTTYTKTVRKFADPPPRRQILYAIDTWEEGLVYETSRAMAPLSMHETLIDILIMGSR